MSPTSLKSTFECLSRSAIECDLEMEYRMAKHVLLEMVLTFFEGVRAVFVDKDHDPKYNLCDFRSYRGND
eukprot:scaffold3350_cov100-Cylindrotheca_fusiformis.AAC.2